MKGLTTEPGGVLIHNVSPAGAWRAACGYGLTSQPPRPNVRCWMETGTSPTESVKGGGRSTGYEMLNLGVADLGGRRQRTTVHAQPRDHASAVGGQAAVGDEGAESP